MIKKKAGIFLLAILAAFPLFKMTYAQEIPQDDTSVIINDIPEETLASVHIVDNLVKERGEYIASTPTPAAPTPAPVQKAYEVVKHYREGSFSDLDMLAQIMWWENGMNGDRCMLLTGSVVLNRVADSWFPNNIYGVWSQENPKQYATFKYIGMDEDIPDHVYDLARDLLENGSVCPANVVYQGMLVNGSGIYEAIPSSYSAEDIEYFCFK